MFAVTSAFSWQNSVAAAAAKSLQSCLTLCDPMNRSTPGLPVHGPNQMVNIEIRLIIFFAAEDGEALYSLQKQDQELTVTQTMNSLLPNLDLN